MVEASGILAARPKAQRPSKQAPACEKTSRVRSWMKRERKSKLRRGGEGEGR